MEEWAYDLYKSNSNFKEYVDKYCTNRGVYLFEALKHKIVLEVGRWMVDNGQN